MEVHSVPDDETAYPGLHEYTKLSDVVWNKEQQRRVLTLALCSRTRDGLDVRDRRAVGSGTNAHQPSDEK